MSGIVPEVTVGVARDADGDLYIPAQQVTGLLRRLSGQWHTWSADGGDPVLDPDTVTVLAAALDEVADQLDVECIARTHAQHQEGGEP